jgi:hypothetical protein
MVFQLEKVVPWGRSFDEYRRMFALTRSDLRQRILGCADGPASFNAELTAAGGTVTSCDPLYRFSPQEIRQRIEQTAPKVIEQARRNPDMFVWSAKLPNFDALLRQRLAAMNLFLADYGTDHTKRRYVDAQLPDLPFRDDAFDIAVCSHFLFLYSDHLSEEFHFEAIHSLIRVARDVRIFPLTALDSTVSPYIDPVTAALVSNGFQVAVETVDYEFQKGAHQMMRIRR